MPYITVSSGVLHHSFTRDIFLSNIWFASYVMMSSSIYINSSAVTVLYLVTLSSTMVQARHRIDRISHCPTP